MMSEQKMKDLIERIVIARNTKAQVEASIKEMESELTTTMEALQRKSVSTKTSLGDFQATYVRSEKINVNEDGLRKHLGAKAFKSVADLKLNRKKLEAALEEGEIRHEDVSPYISSTHGAPYVRYTEKKRSADAEA